MDLHRSRVGEKYFERWVSRALDSGVEALRKFSRSLMRAKEEILNYGKYRITTGLLESFNNTVSRIVHRAYGVTVSTTCSSNSARNHSISFRRSE